MENTKMNQNNTENTKFNNSKSLILNYLSNNNIYKLILCIGIMKKYNIDFHNDNESDCGSDISIDDFDMNIEFDYDSDCESDISIDDF